MIDPAAGRLMAFLARAGVRPVAVGLDEPLLALPPGVVAVAPSPTAFAQLADVTVADLPAGTGPAAPHLALAVAGRVPPPALAVLAAIAGDHQRATPTDPVSAAVGRLLFVLARGRATRRALELGTSAGAATLWLAAALAGGGGHLVSIERDSARREQARQHLRQAGLADRVDLRLGEAARVLRRLAAERPGAFDLVLLDEAPETRADDLALLLPLCARGALVVAHGARAQPAELARFNALLRTHPAIAASFAAAVGDGLELAVVGA